MQIIASGIISLVEQDHFSTILTFEIQRSLSYKRQVDYFTGEAKLR